MNSPVPFTNGEFDLVVEQHEADGFRVLGPGLARALGFRDAFRMMESIPSNEKGYTKACTPGGEQRVGYVTEPGFYRVLGQRQPARINEPAVRDQVERFQSWVYGDVLPSLRRGTTSVAALSSQDILAIAQRLVEQEQRAERAERVVDAIEAAEGLTPTAFHKHYFSDVPEREFFEHLYRLHLLIDQRGARGRSKDGRLKNGYEHGHPAAAGKPFFYLHGRLDSDGARRESTRVRPGRPEVDLVEFLSSKGLPANANALTTGPAQEIAA